jgi:hypothetical protein
VYETEASKFLIDGHFASALGDFMPLAMANALKCCIVLFRSNESMPITYVTPRQSSTNVIFVAYTDCGPGHYDSVIFKDDASLTLLPNKENKCRCGINFKDGNYSSCKSTMDKKHSRCKCLAAKKPCSSLCSCKGCQNPYGIRVSLGKRKRQPHNWQKLDKSNLTVTIKHGQELADGGWSLLESIIFVHVNNHYGCTEKDHSTAEDCLSFYNNLVDYIDSSASPISLPSNALLRKKSMKQFNSKLLHFFKECNQLNK